MGGIIPGYIGDDQRQYRCAAGRCKPAALDGGEMFAHGIYFLNWRAAAEQFSRNAVKIVQRYAFHRQRQQARTAAAEQA